MLDFQLIMITRDQKKGGQLQKNDFLEYFDCIQPADSKELSRSL